MFLERDAYVRHIDKKDKEKRMKESTFQQTDGPFLSNETERKKPNSFAHQFRIWLPLSRAAWGRRPLDPFLVQS